MDSITQTERLRRRGTRFVFYAAVLYSIGGLCIKVIPWNAMSINSGRKMCIRDRPICILETKMMRWEPWMKLCIRSCGEMCIRDRFHSAKAAVNS